MIDFSFMKSMDYSYLKSVEDSELLISYGEIYAKILKTSSKKKKQMYFEILADITGELLSRMKN